MPLKRWIRQRYEYLLEHFGEEEFGRDEAYALLRERMCKEKLLL